MISVLDKKGSVVKNEDKVSFLKLNQLIRTKEGSKLDKPAGRGAEQEKGSGLLRNQLTICHLCRLSRRTEAGQHESRPGCLSRASAWGTYDLDGGHKDVRQSA